MLKILRLCRAAFFAAILVTFSTTSLALEEGLLGFWSFDEGAGMESADLTGNLGPAVFVEDDGTTTVPQWVEGRVGSGLFFDGSSYAKIQDFYGVGGNMPRTIAMWVKTDWQIDTGAQAIVGYGINQSGRRWHFKFEHTTQSIRTENQSGQNFGSDIIVSDNEWHHIASVLPAGGTTIGDVQLYIDGQLLDVNGNGAQEIDTSIDPDEGAVEVTLGMGFLNTTYRFSILTMDELAIWERGLSQEEIQTLVDGARPISEGDPNLVSPTKVSLGQVTAVPPTHEGTFTIRNLGEANAVEISGIDVTGLNPDRFSIAEFPSSLAPGAVGEVKYVFDSKGESGGFSAEFVIKNNEEGAEEFTVGVDASVINLSGPVAHYRLNEAAGSETVNDSSGWGRHGTISGSAELGQDPIAGNEGTGIRVSGGEVRVPAESFEEFEAFSISTWVNPAGLDGTQTILAFGPQTPDFALLTAGDTISWFVNGNQDSGTDSVLQAGVTSHIVATYSASELAIYVDGEAVFNVADPTAIEYNIDSDSALSIGAVNGQLALNGVIDEVQVYNRAISADDVNTLFNSPQKTLGDVLPVDSDGDGLSDEDEVNTHNTDPLVADTDGDGLNDGDEIAGSSNPLEKDSDGGGAWDGYEVAQGTDPTVANDDPAVWTVRTLKARGTVSTVTVADEVIANDDFTNEILQQHPTINFFGTGNGGNFDDDLPFDNIEEIEGADVNDFVVHATTEIFIEQAGTYTFGFNSDDGARLRVSGITAAEFLGTRGTNDSLGTVSLTPGFHTVELVFFERGGGSAVEVYWDPTSGDSSAGFDSNRHELLAATGRVRVDSDDDTLDDNWENAVFGDLSRDGAGDEDGDGLTDKQEHDALTDANNQDTDGDGVDDGPEVNTHNTLPLIADTDGDLRPDGDEINGDPKSNPLVADTDGDGFRDGFEVAQGSDPNSAASLPADRLGEPDNFWTAIEALPTFDNFQGSDDKKDVTFVTTQVVVA